MKFSFKKIVSGIIAFILLISQVTFVSASLLPIEEIKTTIDLSGYLPGELRDVKISKVLAEMRNEDHEPVSIDPKAKLVWSRFTDSEGSLKSDVWKVTDINGTVNLIPVFYTSHADLELIVGSGNQLDPNNVRYIVSIDGPEINKAFNMDLYLQEELSKGDSTTDPARSHVDFLPYYEKTKVEGNDGKTDVASNLRLSVAPGYSRDGYYFAHLTLNEDYYPDAQMRVYDGEFNSAEAAEAAAKADPEIDVTEKLASENMSRIDEGLGGRFSDTSKKRMLTAVYKKNGETVGYDYFYLSVVPRVNSLNDEKLYTFNEKGEKEFVNAVYSETTDEYGVQVFKYEMQPDNPADRNYYLHFDFYDGNKGEINNKLVTKAVEGHYASLASAADAADIKDKLFADKNDENFSPENVYMANFSGFGKDFTVFAGKDIWKLTVVAEDKKEEEGKEPVRLVEPPNVASSDRYFSVEEIKSGGEKTDTYIVPYNQDTYYSFGYQTIFINDTMQGLNNLSPYVRLGYHAKVYKDGVPEDTEDKEEEYGENYVYSDLSPADFSRNGADPNMDPKNSVRYTVSAENHIDHKNYWISVVKKENGPKLFVNGPDTREIFLNDYFSNIHDIFVANIGTEELKNINVTLEGENVALDEYWTIGGFGNNTLAPFDGTVNKTGNYRGELSNVAKIRLKPTGEGDINAVLTITADGQTPRVIKITGKAGNPKIDTTSLRDGVKYVPYSTIVTTNNMHDWNRVTFSLDDGNLPEGVELLPSGEIYGVPKETGSFPIRVKASFSSMEFEPSYADLTLNIKENTDENVAAEVDEGFEILKRIPSVVEIEEGITPQNQIFEYEYDYALHKDEFQGVWLDGTPLEEGVDYHVAAGSTQITLNSQTIKKIAPGQHTIAGANRNSENRLQKSAQNFTKKVTSAKTASTARTGGSYSAGSRGSAVLEQIINIPTYTVSYESNGGSDVESQEVRAGSTISFLATPAKPGYRFAGWYKDEKLTEEFDRSEPVKSAFKLYAKWEQVECRVWFDTDGGSDVESRAMLGDTPLDILPTPKKLGYTFEGWYRNKEFTDEFSRGYKIYQNTTLYAKWQLIPIPAFPPEKAGGFADVNTDDWFFKDVDWAYGSGLISGYNNAIFAPDEPITLAEAISAIAKISGEDTSKFADAAIEGIKDNEWYSPYAKWAVERVIPSGKDFDPDALVTREDMAVLIVKYLDYMHAGYGAPDGAVNFEDKSEVSPEAMEALQILYKNGLLTGKGEDIIAPKDNMSRAEFSSLLHRVDYFKAY